MGFPPLLFAYIDNYIEKQQEKSSRAAEPREEYYARPL
jgi:hypothetical protein